MNILTFDIEDWWVYSHYQIGDKRDWLPRLSKYLNDILDLLDERNFKATFFCLGIVAEEYPDVIKLIDSRGHQIACHSYEHAFMGEKSREYFFQDTKKAIDTLEQATGKKITAYRAPAFSITKNNKWAFEVLAELGIEYDCSVYPANRAFGGFQSFRADKPVIIKYNNAVIKEFPMSLTTIFGKEIAYSGGGYFRLLPYSIIKKVMQQSEYTMTYFHIKDFDYRQKIVFWTRYFQSYYGVKGAFLKLKKLLNDFEFVNLQTVADAIDWQNTECYDITD
jgi:polysaccharide deacetylase family protein (PEP-CTERM system associated)